MWQRSSYCKTDSPMCIEVSGLDQNWIKIRDSKVTDSTEMWWTREEWQIFIDGVKAGEFDLKEDTQSNAEDMMEQV